MKYVLLLLTWTKVFKFKTAFYKRILKRILNDIFYVTSLYSN